MQKANSHIAIKRKQIELIQKFLLLSPMQQQQIIHEIKRLRNHEL